MRDFAKHGYDLSDSNRSAGKTRIICQFCGHLHHNRERTMSVDIDRGLTHCFRCGMSGYVPDSAEVREREERELRKAERTKWQRAKQPKTMQDFVELMADHAAYLASRGIDPDVAKELGVASICKSGTQYIAFRYYLEHEYYNFKGRTLDKKFTQEHVQQDKGEEKIHAPYNIDNILSTDTCIIVEGEIDVLSFASEGFYNTISCPNGANTNVSNWLGKYMEDYINNKEIVYIAADNDKPGIKMQKALVKLIGEEKCRIVSFGEDCKDANEYLCKHGKGSLKQCLDDSAAPLLECVSGVKDSTDKLMQIWEFGIKRGATAAWGKAFDEAISFELGRLLLTTGLPGSGKSEFIDELVLRLSLRHDWPVVYYSPENYPTELHISKLVSKLQGKPMDKKTMHREDVEDAVNLLNERFRFLAFERDMTVKRIVATATELVRKDQCRILVIDPYNRIHHTIKNSETETQYISGIIDEMQIFARKHNVLVILVAHPRKMDRNDKGDGIMQPNLYDVAGSAHFYSKCDYGLIVERHDAEKRVIANISKVRFAHLGTGGKISFQYDKINGRYNPHRQFNGDTPVGLSKEELDYSPWRPGVLLDDEEKAADNAADEQEQLEFPF